MSIDTVLVTMIINFDIFVIDDTNEDEQKFYVKNQ